MNQSYCSITWTVDASSSSFVTNILDRLSRVFPTEKLPAEISSSLHAATSQVRADRRYPRTYEKLIYLSAPVAGRF